MFFIMAADRPLGGTDADLPRYEALLDSLNELDLRPPSTSDAYWERIRDRLLSYSVSQELPKAIKEWARKGMPTEEPGSHCELCDKFPITWKFPIYNKARRKTINIGSECIVNFTHIRFQSDLDTIKVLTLGEIKNIRRRREKKKTRTREENESDDLLDLERAIKDFVRIAGTGEDFPILKHMYAMNDILRVLKLLGVKSPAVVSGDKALMACVSIKHLATPLGITGNQDLGIVELAREIIHRRNLRSRKQLLQSLRDHLITVFKPVPNEALIRLYDEFDDKRRTMVSDVRAKKVAFDEKMRAKYQDFSKFVDRYEHLQFTLEAGLTAARKETEARVQKYEALVMDKGLIARLTPMSGAAVPQMFDTSALFPEVELRRFPSALTKAAASLADFLYAVRHGDDKRVVSALADKFNRPIQDVAGVQAALLQAADDNIVLPESRGTKTIDDFIELMELQSPAVVRLLIKEVDDLSNVRFGEALLFDRMQKELGFDVEDTFRYFDAYNDADAKACRKLVSNFQVGRKPGPDELRIFLDRRTSKPAKPKLSMLDQIRAEIGSDIGWVIKQARRMALAALWRVA